MTDSLIMDQVPTIITEWIRIVIVIMRMNCPSIAKRLIQSLKSVPTNSSLIKPPQSPLS